MRLCLLFLFVAGTVFADEKLISRFELEESYRNLISALHTRGKPNFLGDLAELASGYSYKKRQLLRQTYEKRTRRNLPEEFSVRGDSDDDTSKIRRLVKFMFASKVELLAEAIHESLSSEEAATSSKSIIYYLNLLPSGMLTLVKDRYLAVYHLTLEDGVKAKFSKQIPLLSTDKSFLRGCNIVCKALLNLLEDDREDSSMFSESRATKLASQLYNQSNNKENQVDANSFVEIITKRSFKELQKINRILHERFGSSLQRIVNTVLYSGIEDSLNQRFKAQMHAYNDNLSIYQTWYYLTDAIDNRHFDKFARFILISDNSWEVEMILMSNQKNKTDNLEQLLRKTFGNISRLLVKLIKNHR